MSPDPIRIHDIVRSRGAICRLAALAALAALGGIAAAPAPARGLEALRAQARLEDPTGNTVGTVVLTQLDEGVEIVVTIGRLPPGEHSLHIHQTGVCDAPSFAASGGHFNPHGTEHGFLNPAGPHAGDLPNITVGENGAGSMRLVTARVTLRDGEPHSLFDGDESAVVIHEKPDDYLTDPAGGGGKRIACGVITKIE